MSFRNLCANEHDQRSRTKCRHPPAGRKNPARRLQHFRFNCLQEPQSEVAISSRNRHPERREDGSISGENAQSPLTTPRIAKQAGERAGDQAGDQAGQAVSTSTAHRGRTLSSGEYVMELRVYLKVCEACGCLWFRAQAETTVYCSTCYERFKDFPTSTSRRRRGRPKKTILPAVFAVQASSQSLEQGILAAGIDFKPSLARAGEKAPISLLAGQASLRSLGSLSAGAL